jgi:putative membrane protein
MANITKGRPQGRGSLVRKLASGRLIVALVLLVLAIIFIAENNQKVRIHFIFFTAHSRLWVGFLVSLVFGMLLGQAFFSFRRQRDRQPSREGSNDAPSPGSTSR